MKTLIKCDYDGELPDDLYYRITWTFGLLRLAVEGVSIDRTRRGYHVVILVARRVSAHRVVAIQAILGSDPQREAFNLVRASGLHKIPPDQRGWWNVLYKRHYKGSEVLCG